MIGNGRLKSTLICCLCLCVQMALESLLAEENNENDNSLVAYWSFDEGEGNIAKNKTSNGHDAVFLKGHEPEWVDGFLGKALKFGKDAKACLEVKKSKNMNFKTFTIEAWVKRRPASGQQEIFCKSYDSKQSGGFRFRNSYSMLELRTSDGDKMYYCIDRKKSFIPSNKWTHIAAVYDGKTARIYVNGEEAKESVVDKAYKANKVPVWIGAGGRGQYYHFDGIIDEMRLYSRAKSKDEIFESMSSQALLHSKQANDKKQ